MKQCIFMVVNDNFAIGALVTLYSFLKNNQWFKGDIIIGYGSDEGCGLSEENKEKFINLYYKTKLVELKFGDFYDIFENLIPLAQGGVGFEMTVYKFHAFRLCEYDKVVIFDADMLIIDDVSEIFTNEIKFGALYDVKNEDFSEDLFKIRETEYFNSGIMVIDKEWLKEDVIIGCDEILKNGLLNEEINIKHHKGLYPEQDLLNVYFRNNEVTLIPRHYSADRFYCDENNFKDVKIIHYLTYLKPWIYQDYEGWTQYVWEQFYSEYIDWLNNYTLVLTNDEIKFPKKYEDKDKYLVITCAKNENNYIREWIQHYLDLNFDKIIICDNNDDYSLLDVISDYIERGVVEIFDCRGFKIFQSHILAMFCKEGNYKWCGYFDCDEFLELNGYNDIKLYLQDKQEECVAFNWLLFDSNGNIEYKNDLLANRFTQPYYPINNIENSFVKCLMQGGHFRYSDIINCGGHLFVCKDEEKIRYNFGGYSPIKTGGINLQAMLPLRYKDGYIKHYYTKSFEEWTQKALRGWPDRIGSIRMGRFFKLNNTEKYKRENYNSTLFLDNETFKYINDDCDDDEVQFYIYENVNDFVYAFIARVMYVMSLKNDKVFIITGVDIPDESFNFLLECAYVTNNKIAVARNDDELQHIYNKYKKDDRIIFWKKGI